ncbi:hypothetical protein NN561_000535 [Cricetulus griseus]
MRIPWPECGPGIASPDPRTAPHRTAAGFPNIIGTQDTTTNVGPRRCRAQSVRLLPQLDAQHVPPSPAARGRPGSALGDPSLGAPGRPGWEGPTEFPVPHLGAPPLPPVPGASQGSLDALPWGLSSRTAGHCSPHPCQMKP